jgi:hypothetical protein
VNIKYYKLGILWIVRGDKDSARDIDRQMDKETLTRRYFEKNGEK